ncbi:MAG TPA: Phenylacetic acid catabolic protein [Candidatus Thermoplasmatota archaeon]|nr:Phenylacetic acid catabolic protein [Candidatus Thermoplasmatota archaeon]
MPAQTVRTFDDWIREFQAWQTEIGFPKQLLGDFKFEEKFGDPCGPNVEFGEFKGRPKWETPMQVPLQDMRDGLMNLIVYQGDTEFASVEQQRHLVKTAPTDYDLKSILRVMSEEMRHGWQMCYLLVTHFGKTGAIEAQKQLQRRSWNKERLLGSFNEPVDHWLDFFTYTDFVDRDGKYQLRMLSHSGFAPLAKSMGPMLKEESFHLGTGQTGLRRILQAGKIPTAIVQQYFNKWVPTAFDLFGKDKSTPARLYYVWGLKGRYDEDTNAETPDLDDLNAHARALYRREVEELVVQLNALLAPGEPKLVVPDLKFRRDPKLSEHGGQPYDIHGKRLSDREYEDYLARNLPNEETKARLDEIFKTPDWIAPKGGPAAA